MTGLILPDIRSAAFGELDSNAVFRSYKAGDWKVWEDIVYKSTGTKYSFDTIQRKNPLFKTELVLFLIEDNQAVATASIQRDPHFLDNGLRIIHIHAVPGKRQKEYLAGICKKCLETINELSLNKAWAAEEPEIVNKTLKQIGFREQSLETKEFFKDHTDYGRRIKPLYRWFTNRMIGESTGNTGDARSDESLYRPSSLGTAWASLKEVQAGDDKAFDLFFQAGACSLEKGMTVKFWMAGQGSLGSAPQIWEPDLPGFVEIEAPDHVSIEPVCSRPRVFSMEAGEQEEPGLKGGDLVVGPVTIGFTVSEGRLREGDTVKISLGRQNGFHWKKIAGRKEFKVIIEPGEDEPRMRLPEPVVIRILPLTADYLEAFLPGSAGQGKNVKAVILVRDRHDNRVPYNGSAQVTILNLPDNIDGDPPEQKKTELTAYLSNGRGEIDLGTMGSSPIQLRAELEEGISPGLSNVCVPSAATSDEKVFFGDMHSHDFQSTAEGYPADCYHWARDDKRLDFQSLAIQVHRWIDNEKWTIGKHMNEYFLEEGKFVTFLGFEWQHSAYGDKIIHYLGGDMPYLPIDDPRYADPALLYEALRGTDAFIISHHPGYALDLHVPGTRWETVETDVDRILEIWSMHGSSEGFDQSDRPLIKPKRSGGVYEGLRQGLRMGIAAGSDTHTARPGGSVDDVRPYRGGLCAVWAEDLSRRSLFQAFKERRTYALTDARIVLRFSVNNSPMGSEIAFTEERKLSAQVWAPSPIAEIQFLKNTELFSRIACSDKSIDTSRTDTETASATENNRSDFYHCRVVLEDGNLAVSSPVWVGV